MINDTWKAAIITMIVCIVVVVKNCGGKTKPKKRKPPMTIIFNIASPYEKRYCISEGRCFIDGLCEWKTKGQYKLSSGMGNIVIDAGRPCVKGLRYW